MEPTCSFFPAWSVYITDYDTPGTQFPWGNPISGRKQFAGLSARAAGTSEFIDPVPQDGRLQWVQAASRPGLFPVGWHSHSNSKSCQCGCLTWITNVKCSARPGESSRFHFVLPEAFSAHSINPCNPLLIAQLHGRLNLPPSGLKPAVCYQCWCQKPQSSTQATRGSEALHLGTRMERDTGPCCS